MTRAVVPEGFESYARLFHPASLRVGGLKEPVRWSDIAAANAKLAHPEMQWAHISGVWEYSGDGAPGLWDSEPDTGTLCSRWSEVVCATG